jgi:hypothetical protein
MNPRAEAAERGTTEIPARAAFFLYRICRLVSKVVNQVTRSDAKGFCYSQQSIHRNGPMSIFQQGDKYHRQSRFLGDDFLRQLRLFAVFANGFTQGATMFQNRRHASYKHVHAQKNIYYSLIIILAPLWEKA